MKHGLCALLLLITFCLSAQYRHDQYVKPNVEPGKIYEALKRGKISPEALEINSGVSKGAVITLRNDTVYGQILVDSLDGITKLQTQLTFISSRNTTFLYKPADLKGFIIYKDTIPNHFESVPNKLYMEIVPAIIAENKLPNGISDTSYFIQKIISGYYTLYYVRRAREQGTRMINEKDAPIVHVGPLALGVARPQVTYLNADNRSKSNKESVGFRIKDFYCLKNKEGEMTYLDRKAAPTCFSDNLMIMRKVEAGLYLYEDMEAITAEYNRWKEEKLKSIPEVRY